MATHEKSLNNEFQGGACSARQAGFDFTWTTDIGVEHSHSPSAPCFSAVFHGNHTLLLLPKTHHKTEDHIFPSFPSHLGSRSSWGSRESCNERMGAVSRQMEMLNSWKNNSPQRNGTREGDQSAYVHRGQKNTKYPPITGIACKEASISEIKKRSRQVARRLCWQRDSQTQI